MLTIRVAVLLALPVLVGCNKGPCPSGQELREMHYLNQALKGRGCVEKAEDGSELRQGRWEFFAEGGWKQIEVTYKDGEKGAVTFWDKNGMKLDQAPMIGVKREDGSVELQPVVPP